MRVEAHLLPDKHYYEFNFARQESVKGQDMQNMEAETLHKRPSQVTFIAVLLVIEGTIELAASISALPSILAVGRTIVLHGHVIAGRGVDVVGSVLAGIPILIGVLALVFSLGLWMLWHWAFWATIIIEIGSLLINMLQSLQHPIGTVTLVTGIEFPLLILLYLLVIPKVRRAFHA